MNKWTIWPCNDVTIQTMKEIYAAAVRSQTFHQPLRLQLKITVLIISQKKSTISTMNSMNIFQPHFTAISGKTTTRLIFLTVTDKFLRSIINI